MTNQQAGTPRTLVDNVQLAFRRCNELEVENEQLRCKLAEAQRDAERITFLESGEFHIATDYETGEYELQRVTGNINDREYHIVGTGNTLREAVDAARQK